MGDKTAVLVAAGITVPLAFLLIYFLFRNLIARTRDLGNAIDTEVKRNRTLDPARLRREESNVSSAPEIAGFEDPRDEARAAGATTLSEMAAYFQEQAKNSDDAHKAQIRAHVERTLPPITPDGREAIERGKRARLGIKHVFPPRLPQRSMSFLGGLPIIPDDFDWPTVHNREGLIERLNFMAQIDCSDLPPGPGRDLFPDKGYLYFFAPMSDSFGPDAAHFVTRYLPGPVRKTWEPVDMPATATIQPADPIDTVWRGKRTHYDRVEVEFGWIEEPSDDEVAARSGEGHAFEVADKMRRERMDAFYGPSTSPDAMLSAHKAPKDAPWTPYEGFPANWKTVRILSRFVDSYSLDEMQDIRSRLEALGEVAEEGPEAEEAGRLKALQAELGALRSRISGAFSPSINLNHKDFDAPPEEVKQQIIALMDELRVNGMPSSKERTYRGHQLPHVLNKWLEIAAIHGAEQGLTDPDGASLIPPAVIAALAPRHGAREHQMLGEGVVVQVAADEMKDRHLLMLQLGRDPALDWTIGEMGPLQYWITPEDLAAKRFENTILTIEAY